jgi:hypothetical protein
MTRKGGRRGGAVSPFQLPEEMVMTFPFGYRVLIQKRKLTGYHGDWQDFDAHNTGIIRIRRQDAYDEQLDTLRHELEHALTDWGGRVRKLENDYRAYKAEEREGE